MLEQAAKLAPETRVIVLTAHPSIETAIKAIKQCDKDKVEKQAFTQSTLASEVKPLPDSPIKKIGEIATRYHSMSVKESYHDVAIGISQPVVDIRDGISLDLNTRLIKQNGSHIKLTPTENRLLKVLLENQGELLEHKRLVQLAQGYETNDCEAPFVLRPLVSRLRHKLERRQRYPFIFANLLPAPCFLVPVLLHYDCRASIPLIIYFQFVYCVQSFDFFG